MTTPIAPNTGARSEGANNACTLASTCGSMSPANSPCTTRDATSTSPFWASDASSVASVKPMIPTMKTRWRPNRSPSLPAVMRTDANARMYPPTTHSSCDADAFRSLRMAGSATLTIVTSIRSTNMAKVRTIIAGTRSR